MVAHDRTTAELALYKLGRIAGADDEGYERVMCPAVAGKLRCPLRAASMTRDYSHAEIVAPPEHPPTCCVQQTITVPPHVNAKTAQRRSAKVGKAPQQALMAHVLEAQGHRPEGMDKTRRPSPTSTPAARRAFVKRSA